MKFILTLLFLTFSFSEDSNWWGCSDENALNFVINDIICMSR